METLKTAVIGTGQMGQHHARVYSELVRSELVAIADVDMKRAEEMAAKYDARAYSDYNEMLRKERPDAVSIAVPTNLHARIGVDVLKQTSVLVEKPIADTEESALSIIDASRSGGNILMVGQIERFNPVIQYFRSWVSSHGFNYLGFNIVRIGLPNPRAGISSGVITDLGIHDIDIVRYLTQDEVLNVDARAMNFFETTKYEDHAQIWLKMRNSSASIVTNWTSPVKVREMYVTLDNAFVKIDYLTQSMELYVKNGSERDNRLVGYPKKEINLRYQEPLKLEIKEFLSAVKEGRDPLVTGEDALESLKIALKAEMVARDEI